MSGFCMELIFVNKSQTYTVASAPVATGSVFMRRSRLFFWHSVAVFFLLLQFYIVKNLSPSEADFFYSFYSTVGIATKYL